MTDIQDRFDEIFERREVALGLKEVANIRIAFCSEEKQVEIESLTSRVLRPQCQFDRDHRLMLYALAVAPEQVSWSFKLREKIHRLFHKH